MLNSIAQKVSGKIFGKVKQIRGKLRYQAALAHHAGKLPELSGIDQDIATGLIQDSVHITTLEAIDIPATSDMLQAAAVQLREMQTLKSSATSTDSTKKLAFPHIFTVSDLPQFYTWATHPRLLNIIENYVGLPVQFQGVHLRRDFANDAPVTTEFWHRDMEDYRMVKIFVYLTDATDEYGPLEYIPRSRISESLHRRIQKAIGRSGKMGLTDEQMTQFVPRSEWRRCAVPSGSVVFADPVAVYHHGKSRRQERAALFFVYTSAAMHQPEHVAQYRDDTFTRPTKSPVAEILAAETPVAETPVAKAFGQR